MVSFKASKRELDLVGMILDRVEKLCTIEDRLSLEMDLIACNANGCKLDLKGILTADNFNLMHDVRGIQRHINRETGKLENCFVPRYALCVTKA